jgi:hypothetical protein
MAQIRIPSDTVSSAGRAAHDAGLGALLGGNLYGRVAMHPALAGVGEESERGKVVNRAWRRCGWIHSASLLAIVGGLGRRAGERGAPARPLDTRAGARQRQGRSRRCGRRHRAGLGDHRSAVRAQRTRRAVPLEDGNTPVAETYEQAARLKRRLNVLSTASV